MIQQANSPSSLAGLHARHINSGLHFISKGSLNQIRQHLPPSAPHTYSSFFYNHQQVLTLIRGILTDSLPNDHQIIPLSLLSQLKNHYAPSAIIYAVLSYIFQQPIVRVNFQTKQSHRFFLTDHPTKPTLILEAFINILEEEKVRTYQQALAILDRLEPLLLHSLQQAHSEEQNTKVTKQEDNGRVNYRTSITIDATSNIYQPDDLIYTSSPKEIDWAFFQGLYEGMGRFGKMQARKVVEQLLLLIGMAIFMETVCLEGKKEIPQEGKSEYPMEMPFYSLFVWIKNFSLTVRFLSTNKNLTTLQLNITFPHKVHTITNQELQLKIHSLWTSLHKLTEKRLCVQNMIYLLDVGKQVGQGSFGKVLRCQALQLIGQQTPEKSSKASIFWFRRSTLAAKQLRLTPQQQMRLEIPANREHLILGMVGELRHREKVKNIRRQIGMQTEQALVGVKSIIPLLDCFRHLLGYDSRGRAQQQFFLIFPLGQYSLAAHEFQRALFTSPLFHEQLYMVFSRVFQGLSCLHFEIGRLYPYQLIRYYKIQNGDEGNSDKQPLDKLVLGGKYGVCLRDVKPNNIVVQMAGGKKVGRVWLIDMGMARIGDLSLRTGATNCGSDYFMAPQVRLGGRQDERIDVWGAAVSLFQMLSKGSRLYASLEMHAMKTVNDNIQQRISQVAAEQDAWGMLLRATLVPRIQTNHEKTPIRQDSRQIVQLMRKEAWRLSGKQAIQGVQSTKRKSYMCKQEDGDMIIIQLQGISEQNMKMSQLSLRNLIRHALGTPNYCLKMLLVCFYHARTQLPSMDRLQLIQSLANMCLVTLTSTHNNNSIICPYVSQQIEVQNNQDMLKDMQQTVFFGQLSREITKRHVIIDTHAEFRLFKPNQQEGCGQVKYFKGFSMSEKLDRMKSALYNIRNFTQVQEYMGIQRLFAAKTVLGETNVFFLKKKDQIQTSLQEISQIQLVQMAKMIEKFLNWQQKDIITIDILKKQIQEPNFAHIMTIKTSKSHIKASFNPQSLTSILKGSGFCQGMKQIIRKILNSDIQMGLVVKGALQAFLKSKSYSQFNEIKQNEVTYISQERLRQDLKQLLGCLFYIIGLPAISYIKKGTIKAIKTLKNLQIQKIKTPGNVNPLIEADLRFINEYCLILPQINVKTQKKYEKMLNFTMLLGKKVVNHVLYRKILFTNDI